MHDFNIFRSQVSTGNIIAKKRKAVSQSLLALLCANASALRQSSSSFLQEYVSRRITGYSTYLNGSLNYVAPKGESTLRSSDGIVSLSIYNDNLYIKYDKDASKDYYAELAISTSGMVLITNDSSGYHTKQIVNFQ